jgi:uncharacterized membrane protein YqjE
MSETPQSEDGLLAPVTRLLKTLVNLLENRLELFLVEVQEERVRLVEALLLAVAGGVAALMTLILITLTVVVIFWDSHRVLVLVLFSLAYATATAVAFRKLRARLNRWQAFTASLHQIKKDRAWLEKQN